MESTVDGFIPISECIYPRKSLFNFNNILHFNDNDDEFNKIVVIGVIGKSYFGNGSILHSITGISCFHDHFEKIHQFNETNDVSLYYYYDNTKNIIYLHFSSPLDRKAIDLHIDNINKEKDSKEFIKWLDKTEYQCIKGLLYVFLISHFIFDINPSSVIRLEDFKLYRILQKSKKIMIQDINKYFSKIDDKLLSFLPRSLLSNLDKRFYPGYCIPYLFFVFHAPKYLPPKQSLYNKKKKNNDKTIEETLKINLEIQLKELLRINRLDRGSITRALSREKDTQNILFTLDPKGFIYIISQRSQNKESSLGIISSMIQSQLPDSIFGNKYLDIFQPSSGPAEILSYISSEQSISSGVSSLSTFTFRLAQQSLKSRSISLPSLSIWYNWSLILGDFFLFGSQKYIDTFTIDIQTTDNTEKIHKLLNPNAKFSSIRCKMILSKVKDVYYHDIPEIYTKIEHEGRILKALQLYYTHARGLSVNIYKKQLLSEFNNYWNKGRQRCECRSLTGHYCKYPLHNTPISSEISETSIILSDNDDSDSENDDIFDNSRILNHSTNYLTIGSCNCGKTRKTRKDPFLIQDANCEFFKARCCNSMKSIDLPNKNWNLVIIGSAYSYEPNVGMAQDGFKMRYKYLIPYELNAPKQVQNIPKKQEDEEFPSLQNSFKSKRKRNEQYSKSSYKHSKKNPGGGWIGYEYECPVGHRFIEPIHIILSHANINSEQSVLNIETAFTTEIPLYTNCKSTDKQHNLSSLAKLQRVYITTPVNLALKINPRVLITGIIGGSRRQIISNIGNQLSLPSDCFLCLRLPYIYTYENTPLEYQQNISTPYQCGFKLVN